MPALGEKLSGWGKIALMYELDYTDATVREWTLRKGCCNTIGLSYLANVCAIKGKMKDYLKNLEDSNQSLDSQLATGICNIFNGLLEDHSKNDGIYEYPDAKESARLFRALAEVSSEEVKDICKDVIHMLDVRRI